MKTRQKVSGKVNSGNPVPPSNNLQKEAKNDLERGVSDPPFEADSQKEGGYTRTALTFFSNKDGEIAWDRMRDGTREELRKFVTRPDVRKNLGLEKEESEKDQALPAFGQDEATAFFDGLGTVAGFSASLFYHVPREITSRAFTFTEEHRRKLSPVYIRLMNKWGPSVVKTWKDEIGAAFLTVAVVNSQIHLMKMYVEQERKKEPRTPVAPKPVQPIYQPEKNPNPPTAAPEEKIPEKKVAQSEDILETVGFGLEN